ncbi:Copper amine oxidase, N2 domain-containing protein [Cladophialophora immunda]|nr:Copper amine oxidase, N2 domain-containing protein [Cladophialophora immunda]
MPTKHPTDPLDVEEIEIVRKSILQLGETLIYFRSIFLLEPDKEQLIKFLEYEHDGTLTEETPRPPRVARAEYDIIDGDQYSYVASLIDIASGRVEHSLDLGSTAQVPLAEDESQKLRDLCDTSPDFQDACESLDLSLDLFDIVIDAWPYEELRHNDIRDDRLIRGICFARPKEKPRSNQYAFPLSISPIIDVYSDSIVRVERLATGGSEDGMKYKTGLRNIIGHCCAAEYSPESIEGPTPIGLELRNFGEIDSIPYRGEESLVIWQNWRFRVSYTPREGAVLHDIRYDGRSVLYRLSLSGVVSLQGDPRNPPYHKQPANLNIIPNNIFLPSEGVKEIKNMSAIHVDGKGNPITIKNAIRIYEEGSGVGWIHTEAIESRSVVMKSRSIVVEFMFILSKQDYLLAFKFDESGGIRTEIRLSGILPVVNIDPEKKSNFGCVVAPGVLAQNSQHFFAIRIDPAVDGYKNKVVLEHLLPPSHKNIRGSFEGLRSSQSSISTPVALRANPYNNTIIKIENPEKINPISGTPVAYQFTPLPCPLRLIVFQCPVDNQMDWTDNHLWITAYRDGQLYVAGDPWASFEDGVAGDIGSDTLAGESNPVLWSVVGFTNTPRTEDWPVTAAEKLTLYLKPANFFTKSPSLIVPPPKDSYTLPERPRLQTSPPQNLNPRSAESIHESPIVPLPKDSYTLPERPRLQTSPPQNLNPRSAESIHESNEDSQSERGQEAESSMTRGVVVTPTSLSSMEPDMEVDGKFQNSSSPSQIRDTRAIPSSPDANNSVSAEVGGSAENGPTPPRFKDTIEDWMDATTYGQVIHLSCRYLKGKQTDFPYHDDGPIDIETQPLVPLFLRMHEYGFLTYNSQPSISDKNKESELETRGFVSFLVPQKAKIDKSSVERFYKELEKREEIIVTVRNADGIIVKTNQTNPTLPLGRYRGSSSESWIEDSASSLTRDSGDGMFVWTEIDCRPVVESEPLDITVATQGFGVDFSLSELIIDCAECCGIFPVYKSDTIVETGQPS